MTPFNDQVKLSSAQYPKRRVDMTDERNGNGPPPGDDGLPRDVGYDPEVDEPLRETHVLVTYAARAAHVTEVTIQRHLRQGSLAGMRVGPIWLVEREALRWWAPDKPGPKPGG